MLVRWFALMIGWMLALTAAVAQPRLQLVAEGLQFPSSLVFLPEGGMLVTERPGRLRVVDSAGVVGAPIEGVPAVHAAGQGGLLEVLLARDFSESRRVYLSYSHGTDDANTLRVARARFDGKALVDLQVLMEARPMRATSVHYGGRIAWAADGTLLVATGDGFDYREQAQRLDNHLGKILRIAADGSVPPDNPFVGRGDALAEIYSVGHRNVQGLVVDEAGTVWSHEHGPRGGDEFNRIVAGGNYGWPLVTHGVDYSGALVSPFTTLPDMIDPLHVWTPSIAPSGLMRYRGDVFAAWRGDFFVAALAGKQLQRLRMDADGGVRVEAVMFDAPGERLRDVREGLDGGIYLLTDSAQGKVLRVVGE